MRRAVGYFLLVLYGLGPTSWLCLTSLKPPGELGRLPPVLPARPTLVHYERVFAAQPFLRVLANGAGIAGLTALLGLGLALPAAFALTTLRLPGGRTVLLLFLAVGAFPAVALVLPLYGWLTALGLRDTWAGVVLVHTLLVLPLTLWVLTAFLRDVPRDLYRQARVDGLTPLGALGRILLPAAAPGLVTAGLLAFVGSWNEFLFVLTLTGGVEARTVPVAIALFTGVHDQPWGEIAAASTLGTLPLVAAVFLGEGRIVAGLTGGAVKE